MFNTLQTARLYAVPLTPAYWRDASHSMRCLRLLIFAALTVAMARALARYRRDVERRRERQQVQEETILRTVPRAPAPSGL